MNEHLNKWINQSINQWNNKWMNIWTFEQMNEWINESMNEWMNIWTNEGMKKGFKINLTSSLIITSGWSLKESESIHFHDVDKMAGKLNYTIFDYNLSNNIAKRNQISNKYSNKSSNLIVSLRLFVSAVDSLFGFGDPRSEAFSRSDGEEKL